jgi:hypothetical protein
MAEQFIEIPRVWSSNLTKGVENVNHPRRHYNALSLGLVKPFQSLRNLPAGTSI